MADPNWARILPALMELKNTVPDIHDLTEADRAERYALLRTVLERGIDEGLLHADVDVATTTNLLVGPLMLAVLSDDLAGLGRLADEVTDVFVAACRHRAAGPR
jgi:hypothetical protein